MSNRSLIWITFFLLLVSSCSKDEEITYDYDNPEYWKVDAIVEEGGIEYHIKDGYASVTNAKEGYETIKILSDVRKDGMYFKVTSINSKAFFVNKDLKKLYIPSTIEKIGNGAFTNTVIESVYIENLESWCEIEFENETSNPFSNDTKLYVSNNQVTELILPAVKEISNYAFKNLNCKKIVINDATENIGNYCFANCQQLEELLLGNGMMKVSPFSFSDCINLKEIKFSENIREIDSHAFSNCKNLKEVQFNDRLGYIEERGFEGCESLEFVYLPDSMYSIGPYAFIGCSKDLSFYVSSLEKWMEIKKYYDEGSGEMTFKYPYNIFINDKLLENLILPEDLKKLEDGAFRYSSIKSVKFDKNFEELGTGVFENCSLLEEVDMADANIKKITYLSFANCENLKTVKFSPSTESMEFMTFFGCESLQNINFPESLKKIYQAFCQCNGLTEIILPEGLESMEDDFWECKNLKSVSVPSSLNYFNESFMGCESLNALYMHCTVIPESPSYLEFDSELLSRCTLFVPAESLEIYQTTAPWKGFENILPIE